MGWNPRASADEQWKLGRTRALLDLDGAPDRRLQICLVAGTKGKGSTSAMLASILSQAGLRCGLYTKPHLQTYRERIRVDGRAISLDALATALERMRVIAAQLPSDAGEPTTFEVTTALALAEFARQRCTVAVVEVGLGGRLDATNATDPDVSVITSISYDHTAILGRTLGQIAREKAGILRPGRPAFLAHQRPAAARALREACGAVGAQCVIADPWPGQVALAGAHQHQNAGLAVAAARALHATDQPTLAAGLARVHWPGRFERVGDDVVLDGAHNDASAVALATTLRHEYRERQVFLVLGLNRDKDARAVLSPLLSLNVGGVWVTAVSSNARALPPTLLAREARRRTSAAVYAMSDLRAALLEARRAAAAAHGIACVTGSLALVGAARDALGLDPPEHLW